MTLPRALVLWSGGKDCLLALDRVRGQYDVVALLTTITPAFDRVSVHGLRTALVDEQARQLGLPLRKVVLPWPCRNEDYEQVMRDAWQECRADGVEVVVTGDLFLEEVRRYREERLYGSACRCPLWGEPTDQLARAFLERGFRATVCVVDTQQLSADFAGRPYDADFLQDLPAAVDPCGENGEFHTFVHDGPGFAQPITFHLGERVLREERFAYCDLVPGSPPVVIG